MSARAKLFRRWWQRFVNRSPHSWVLPLTFNGTKPIARGPRRHPKLERLERRDLMVADPMFMVADPMLDMMNMMNMMNMTNLQTDNAADMTPTVITPTVITPTVITPTVITPTVITPTDMTTAGPSGLISTSPPDTSLPEANTNLPDPISPVHPTVSSTVAWDVGNMHFERLPGLTGIPGLGEIPAIVGRVVPQGSPSADTAEGTELFFTTSIHVAIEWNLAGVDELALRTWVEPDGTFVQPLRGLPHGQHTIPFRMLVWEFGEGGMKTGSWQSFSFLHLAAAAPTVVELRIVDHRGENGHQPVDGGEVDVDTGFDPVSTRADTLLGGAVLEGVVRSRNGQGVPYAPVYLDLNGDGLADARTTADEDGRFRYLLGDLASETLSVRARSSRWDTTAQAEVHGEWGMVTQREDPLESPQAGFDDVRLVVNGAPAIHQEFQRQIQQAQQRQDQFLGDLAQEPNLSAARTAYREQLEDAWNEYQATLNRLSQRLLAEQQDAHRVHALRVMEAEQVYRDIVHGTSMPDLSNATTMEEMMLLYHQHWHNLEVQAQLQRADLLAEARRELLHRMAAAQRQDAEQRASAESKWKLAEITSTRELSEVRADWSRWEQKRQVIAWKNLCEDIATAVLHAARQKANDRLHQLQESMATMSMATMSMATMSMATMSMAEYSLEAGRATESDRVTRSSIQLELANALDYIVVQYGESITHATGQFNYHVTLLKAKETRERGIAEGEYYAAMDHAEKEYDYLRAAIPLQAAQLTSFNSDRAEQLTELRQAWELAQAEIQHAKTYDHIVKLEKWSQTELEAHRVYQFLLHRLDQARTEALSEQQARSQLTLAKLDAEFFQFLTAARGEHSRTQSAAMMANRIEQAESEVRFAISVLDPDLDPVHATREKMDSARVLQRVTAEVVAIDRAVVAQTGHELNWANRLASAHQHSAERTSAATHAHLVAMSLVQRDREDRQVDIETAYIAATRAAHWDHERLVADARLAEVRGEITADQIAERLETATRTKRQQEAAAFVVKANAVAAADLQLIQQTTNLTNQHTGELTEAARMHADATIEAETALTTSKLSDWRLAADSLDHSSAESDRQRLIAELQWLLGVSTAHRDHDDFLHVSRRDEQHAALLAQVAIGDASSTADVIDLRANTLLPQVSDMDSVNDSPETAQVRLSVVGGQGLADSSARAWRAAQLENLELALAELTRHDDQWIQAISSSHVAGLEASSAAQIEYQNRLVDAVIRRSTSQRSNQEEWMLRRMNAEAELNRQSITATTWLTQEITAAEGEYLVAAAVAHLQWTATMAQASADLYVSGQAQLDATSHISTLSDAQQNYRETSRQSEQLRQAQLRAATIRQAERIGDGLIERARQVGSAGIELAEENGRAGLLFTQVNSALETSYAIAVSEAERRLVDAMAATAARSDVELARAIATVDLGVSQVHEEYLERMAGSTGVLFGQLLEPELVSWSFSGFAESHLSPDFEWESWAKQIAPFHARHQLDLVTADGRYAIDMARQQTQLTAELGQIDIALAESAGEIRKDFARDASAAVRQYQMSSLNADNLLLQQGAYHDQTRAREFATLQASYDLDAAAAAKEYLVGMAGLDHEASLSGVHRQWEISMAELDARYEIQEAEIDHLWTTDMLSAEEFHTRFVLAAMFSMERDLVRRQQAMHDQLAEAAADQNSAQGRELANWMNRLADAGTQWQGEVADAYVELRDLEWAGWGLIVRDIGLGDSSSSSVSLLNDQTHGTLGDWQSEWLDAYRDWVGQRGGIQRYFVRELGRAHESYVNGIGHADRRRVQADVAAEASRRLTEINAWDMYTQYMVSPSRELDQSRADADRDLKIAEAVAERERIVTGDALAHQSRLITATAHHRGKVESAQQKYLQAELVAASSRDQQWLAAADEFASAVTGSGQDWADEIRATRRKWNEDVMELDSEYAASLRQQDESYASVVNSLRLERLGEGLEGIGRIPPSFSFHLPDIWNELRGQELAWIHASSSGLLLPEIGDVARAIPGEFSSELARVPSSHLVLLPGHFTSIPIPSSLSEVVSGASEMEDGDATAILETIHASMYQPGILAHPRNSSPARWAELASMDYQLGDVFGSANDGFPVLGASVDRDMQFGLLARSTVGGLNSPSISPSSPLLATHVSNVGLVESSSWGGFFRDVSLMTQNPMATVKGAAVGFVTSGKVLVNGTLTTLKSAATLGLASSPVEVLEITELDRAHGYDTSFAILRASQELLIGATTGKLAAVKYPGRLGQIATGAYYWDAAQNSTSAIRGGYGVAFGEGWTTDNSLHLAGGLLGLSGNIVGRTSPTQRAPHPLSAEVLAQPRIGLGVNLDGKGDPIGHAFITLDPHLGETMAVGFYPDPGFDLRNLDDLRRLLGQHGGLSAVVQTEKPELVQHAGTLIQKFRVTDAQFQRARQLVQQIQNEANAGQTKYHAASQCATFARQVMREAGVRTFLPIPYPPLMYATLWFKRTLG